MASQLRWILLGLGLALIAGLWWWERRRPSAAPEESLVRGPDRFEPRLDTETPGTGLAAVPAAPPTPEPPMRALDGRLVPRGDPPLVTIDDLPENIDSVMLAPQPLPDERPETSEATEPTVAERRRSRSNPPPPTPPPAAPAATGHASPAADSLAAPPPAEPARPPAERPPRQQRIVAIRLLGDRERRIDGADLKKALAAEGLAFGRYAIFHRLVQGGRPLYSIASLVEPGSFDEEQMASSLFPGISIFAVYPGPMAAPQAFDELLATARRLAERLSASLQDDAGSSLTGQRVLSIREELVHFEHLVVLSRSRPGA